MNERVSKALFEEAKGVIPGGVNSPVRAFGSVGRTPLFIDHASGSHIYDVDGNDFIDYVCSWGPGILGHAEPKVVEAVQKACESGLTFGAPTRTEVVLAEMIRHCFPSMELTRLVSSGTEAVMSAIRVARGYTGREMIVKFRGCYHGHSDGLLVKAGSAALTGAVPDSAGVPVGYSQTTLIAEYNDCESVAALFEKYGSQIAAVVVEPVAANMGVVLPEEGFLPFLRKITQENGALLIFDEVITGFRLNLGGAAGYYHIVPDLITLGKIVGGGMPLAAYGGKKEIMEMIAPLGPVYQAGTLSGNPVATAAGVTTVSQLIMTPGIYSDIEKKTEVLAKAVRETGAPVQVNQIGSLMSVFFTDKPVKDYAAATSSDTARYAKYFSYLLEHGVYVAPSQYEAMFISAAHSDEEIAATAKRMAEAVKYAVTEQ